MLLWTVLCLIGSGIQLIFWHLFFSLLSVNVRKSELYSTPCLTILRTLFLLVEVVFKATFTGLWHRLSNNLSLACLSLQLLWDMAGPDQGLVLASMNEGNLWQSVVVAWWQRSLAQTLGQRVVIVTGSALVVLHLLMSLTLRRRGAMGDRTPDDLQSTTSLTSSSSMQQVGTPPTF